MNPVIALVGQPNVGKSTLFNRLTQTRAALVADLPGLTRDRQYGLGKLGGGGYIVVDTGGFTGAQEGVAAQSELQARRALEAADGILLLVDGRFSLNAFDHTLALQLRKLGKPLVLGVNKTEGLNLQQILSEFHTLGLGQPWPISAAHGTGVIPLLEHLLSQFPRPEADVEPATLDATRIRVALFGRPNAGKSTLINRMLGEDRVIVSPQPGTTRDSIFIPFSRDAVAYTLIDTAGVRRRSRVSDVIEKFSIIKTLQAVEAAQVTILVLDAHSEISEQDATLAGLLLEQNKGIIVVINKWDGLNQDGRTNIRRQLDIKLPFLSFAPLRFISALHGSGVGDLFPLIQQVHQAATAKLETHQLTELLAQFVAKHQPPLVHGRRIKLRYAHQGGQNLLVIHGNQTEAVPEHYTRYLAGCYRDALKLIGVPLRIEYKTGHNPYAGKKNVLTPRQIQKRQRLMRHVRDS